MSKKKLKGEKDTLNIEKQRLEQLQSINEQKWNSEKDVLEKSLIEGFLTFRESHRFFQIDPAALFEICCDIIV